MPFASDGRWTGVLQTPGDSMATGDGMGVFVIHATLLHTGEVLWFSGHVEGSHYLAESYVWDPTQPVNTAVSQPFPAANDVFCCHHANLDDGRVITVGGAAAVHGRGISAICLFDPASRTWTQIGDMQRGRWYPTLVTLPDGRLVVFSGRTEPGGSPFINPTVELLSPPFVGPGYTPQVLAGADKTFPTYPGLHLVPGGRIVHTGPTWQYEDIVTTPIGTFSFREIGPSAGAWTDEGVSPVVDRREEGMSVLLPPAQDGRILLVGGANATAGEFHNSATGVEPRSAEILDTLADPPTWTRIGDMAQPRINASVVLLPDGRVLVLGGHDRFKGDTSSVPSNQAELYDPVLNTWTNAATMGVPRMYHSTALLLPDGRVVVAGGYDPNGPGDGNRKSFEFYEPPYFFNPDDTVAVRSTITGVAAVDGPADQIAYGGQLIIDTPDAVNIRKVGLMRPGSMTHHTDSEQRYVALEFVAGPGANQLTALAPGDPSVAPPGYYMLWIVDANNRPCQRARFVRLLRSRCFVIVDRSHYSNAEVQALPATTDFDDAFYVILDGFLPSELGITSATPTTPPPAAIAPAIVVKRADSTVVAELTAQPQALLYELPALPAGVRQRFTFRYRLSIAGTAPFFENDGVTPIEMQTLTIEATSGAFVGRGAIRLHHQPNPFMLDGATSWLSIDLQVLNVREGEVRNGQPAHGAADADAVAFIRGVLNRFNGNAATGAAEFAAIASTSSATTLDWSYTRGSQRTFNYAVAKVRYRGLALPAANVRLFFRLFTVAATGTEFRSATTYKTLANVITGDPIPGLGLVGSEIGTIPFFATQRVNTALQRLSDQDDPPNVQTLAATGGPESATYFGCWLDFNNTAARYPWHPADAVGPFASGLQSIATLINGRHQCLVSEIHFSPSVANPLVVEGDSPGSSDKLAQRNLAIVYSTNPGTHPTRTVQHPFELAPMRSTFVGTPATPAMAIALERRKDYRFVPSGPDELMVVWNTLPRQTEVDLFLPQLNADDVARLAGLRIGPNRVERVDAHTIRCQVGDVTYLPLPDFGSTPLAGLVTLRLPPGVRYGQVFRVVFQQLTAAHQVVGQFELCVRVEKAESIVDEEVNTLAVARHVAAVRPASDRWKPVLLRYADQLAERVQGLGVNPDLVQPSPLGADGSPALKASLSCRLFAWLTLLLAALTPLLIGLLLGTAMVAVAWIAPVAFLAVLYLWQVRCTPGLCLSLRIVGLGLLIGAGLLALVGGPAAAAGERLMLLAALLVLIGGLALVALARRCGGGGT